MSVDGYLEARGALEDTKRKIAELASLISKVGDALTRSPDDFLFSNVPVGIPPEHAFKMNAKFDATNGRPHGRSWTYCLNAIASVV